MRTIPTALGLALGLLLATGHAQAGLYNTAEPRPNPLGLTFQQFRLQMSDLRSIPNDQRPSPARNHVLKQVADLEAKERAGRLTVEDRVNLAAYDVRLLKAEEAVRALAPAEAREPDNFLVLANLATATYLVGTMTANPAEKQANLQQAVLYQRRALKAWPAVWVGFTLEQLRFYRRAERYYLRLLEHRWEEARSQNDPAAAERGGLRSQGGAAPGGLDPLFPGVRFVGPSGQYQAGAVAPEVDDALPVECIAIITQLCLWLPFDDRLYWQLGELMNAKGNMEDAYTVLDELEYARGVHNSELHRHRQVLLEALREARKAAPLLSGDGSAVIKEQLLWELTPRGATAAPGAGSLAAEAAWMGALGSLSQTGTTAQAEPAATAGPAKVPWLPDWRTFGVGVLTGAVVALLVGLQLRHGRRRTPDDVRMKRVG
jgi:hypothetical protein